MINNATNTAVVGATVTDTVPAVLGVPQRLALRAALRGQPFRDKPSLQRLRSLPSAVWWYVSTVQFRPNTTGVITNVATLVPPAGSSCVPMLGNARHRWTLLPYPSRPRQPTSSSAKYAAQGSYVQGGPISYSIQVSNVGGSVANNVALGDVVPRPSLSSVTCAPPLAR